MDVVHKDATITATDDDGPGTFEAILSAPTKDRDGDTLLPDEWKMPLPDHITVDLDHGMSVEKTIGSAHPWLDDDGNLRISGKFASTAKAQEVRTLVKEGHINRTSVAFMSERTKKDGVTKVSRELLNAALVAIPANREAVILSAKAAGTKSGRRNSAADQTHLNAIVNHALALGADLSGGDDENDEDVAAGKSFTAGVLKSVVADAIAAHEAGTMTADEALTLIRDAQSTGEPAGDRGNDDGNDSAAEPGTAAAADAAAAVPDEAAVDQKSIEQELVAARMRFYATLSERN